MFMIRSLALGHREQLPATVLGQGSQGIRPGGMEGARPTRPAGGRLRPWRDSEWGKADADKCRKLRAYAYIMFTFAATARLPARPD